MAPETLVTRLLSVLEPEGSIVTLGLNLGGTRTVPEATRIFVKDVVLENLGSEARPPATRSLFRKLGRDIQALLDGGLESDTRGLYLVAGRTLWTPVEFKVHLPNSITTGSRAFLPPLLALYQHHPRGYLVTIGGGTLKIQEVQEGVSRTLFEDAALPPEDNRQHIRSPRSKFGPTGTSGRGGSERDRRQQREGETIHALLRRGAEAVRIFQSQTPAAAVFLASPRDLQKDFERHLGPAWRGGIRYLGTAHEGLEVLVTRELETVAADRLAAELREFHDARAEGGKVALGPNDVLQAVWNGQARRVYLDESDPIPGVVCTGCGTHWSELELRCPFCGEEVKPTSIAQDVVVYAKTHKPEVELTFVGPKTDWLRDLGGITAQLALKGANRRIASVAR